MQLKRLIDVLPNPRILNFRDLSVKGITCDSKAVRDGFLFVAIKGSRDDGHCFIDEALKNGAAAIVAQIPARKEEIPKDSSWITVENTRRALAALAGEFYGHPSKKLKVIGVTGTNGKTTTTYLIENLLKEAGFKVGVIGTINYRYKEKIIPAINTTPGPLEIQSLLAQMLQEGIDYVIMEVSSHALDQERVDGLHFTGAIFTNLTQDHLDYHATMEEYFQAKAKLFQSLPVDATSIINSDDAYSRRLLDLSKTKIITYGLDSPAAITARDIRFDIQGTRFIAKIPKDELEIKTQLIGRHNVYNILAAVSLAVAEDLPPKIIKNAINKFTLVPGRLERIDCQRGFCVFVDYAHTDDALKNVLLALKELAQARTIVVFGCGGNRDKKKRPKMGEVASTLADFAIVTSDNPRNEEPEEIIKDIVRGIK